MHGQERGMNNYVVITSSMACDFLLYYMMPYAGPDVKQIQVAVVWARQQLEKGLTLFVHCAHGHGRSATVLGAVLIALGEVETVGEAVKMMQRSRPRVRLNNRQRASLNAWYEEHHLKSRG